MIISNNSIDFMSMASGFYGENLPTNRKDWTQTQYYRWLEAHCSEAYEYLTGIYLYDEVSYLAEEMQKIYNEGYIQGRIDEEESYV